jgi:septal ring factor EnvC (AmiA/AmiB activator)
MPESHDKVERRLDELYRGAPEDFTAGRNELAAELKAASEAEAAADVKRLKRPTQAASVVNRLSLDHPGETQALLDAAERLRDVHSQLGAAGSGERLREAARQERQSLERLTEIARQMGPRQSASTLHRVGETLQAVGSDEEVARLVRTGRLDRERRAAGVTGGATPARSRAATKPAKDRSRELKEVRAALEKLRRREKRIRTTQEKALERRADAESKLEDARGAVTESENELTSIEGEIADRERELRHLEG